MRKGAQTLVFESKPVILSRAAIGGKKEGEGPLAAHFDFLGKDAKLGQKTFEKAESKLQELALDTAKRKLGISYEDIDVLFAGDLLNQCISSSFAARGTSIPFPARLRRTAYADFPMDRHRLWLLHCGKKRARAAH